jgi:hypothetical protein
VRISSDVIWGKNIGKGEGKEGENVKKRRNCRRKRKKGERKSKWKVKG